MRLFLFAASAGMLVLAAPAHACLSEPMPEAIIFDGPPAHTPPGHTVFKVVAGIEDPDTGHLLVRIAEPAQARRLGPSAWLYGAASSSCTTWGRIGRPGYVVARVAGKLGGRTLLEARAYRRSWVDHVRNWFGWETYRASGRPL